MNQKIIVGVAIFNAGIILEVLVGASGPIQSSTIGIVSGFGLMVAFNSVDKR